jgi:alanyl-tRNA synthetase
MERNSASRPASSSNSSPRSSSPSAAVFPEQGDTVAEATKFVGYSLDATHATHAKLVDVVKTEKDTYLVFDQTPFYGEMGGQVGDAGHAPHQRREVRHR